MPFPSATPTPLVADLGQVVFSENFDDQDFPFNVYGPYRIENFSPHQNGSGILVLEREEGYQPPPDMWPTDGLYETSSIALGVTSIILFKTAGNINFNIGYHTGVYGTDSLRRFNYNSSGRWDLYEEKSATTIKSWNARSTRTNVWYYFSITRSANGDMDAKLWEQGKPETMFKFHGNMGTEWGRLNLTFFVDFRWGSFMLDEYQELK